MEHKLTIGCITSSVSYQGGWDTLSKGIIGAVAKKHAVVILTASDAVNDEVPYHVHAVLPKNYSSYSLLTQIGVFISAIRHLRRCDIIHVFVEPYAPGAALAAKLLNKPMVITLAGTYCVIPKGNSLRQRVKRILMKFMYRQASFIATGSMRNIELIEEVMPLGKKWKFVPFGVDLDKYSPDEIKSDSKELFLLTVGGVKPRKGALYTIKALNELKDEFPELTYKIAGSYRETPYLSEVREEIDAHNLKDRVELMGRVEDDELYYLYKNCAIFVLAAQTIDGSFEGFPMVFYEAHALGAPIVTTTGFGSEYVIKNGYNGFLVEQGQHKELADAIRKILKDKELRDTMSQNGIEEAKKHTWDTIGTNYLEAYENITHHNA